MHWFQWALHHLYFHWTYLPQVIHQKREKNKRLLNLRMINHIISAMPNDAKHCVSYGQLAKTYFTVPATSTQGTTKESDKDYIVRIAMPPEMDMNALLLHFDVFRVNAENLAST